MLLVLSVEILGMFLESLQPDYHQLSDAALSALCDVGAEGTEAVVLASLIAVNKNKSLNACNAF